MGLMTATAAALFTDRCSTNTDARHKAQGQEPAKGSSDPSQFLRLSPGQKGPDITTSRYIKGKSSAPAAQQENTVRLPRASRKPSYIIREETKRQYYKDLCQQVEEKKQQAERSRTRNAIAERTHNETMQQCMWGVPGGGAPNHLGSVRRTKLLSTAGIVPQEQLHCKGFSGTPFHLHVK
ncbi:uncharacterized protein LOC144543505 [Centroberyx gerrardi]